MTCQVQACQESIHFLRKYILSLTCCSCISFFYFLLSENRKWEELLMVQVNLVCTAFFSGGELPLLFTMCALKGKINFRVMFSCSTLSEVWEVFICLGGSIQGLVNFEVFLIDFRTSFPFAILPLSAFVRPGNLNLHRASRYTVYHMKIFISDNCSFHFKHFIRLIIVQRSCFRIILIYINIIQPFRNIGFHGQQSARTEPFLGGRTLGWV